MDDVPDLAALRRDRMASDAEYIEQLEQFTLGQERENGRLRERVGELELQAGDRERHLNDALKDMRAERDRLRAALTMIAIPPSNTTRDDHPLVGCTGCARLAQLGLDGHDFQPNVARLDGGAEVTDG